MTFCSPSYTASSSVIVSFFCIMSLLRIYTYCTRIIFPLGSVSRSRWRDGEDPWGGGPMFGPAWVLSLGPAYCPTVRDLNTPQASPHGTVVQEYHRSSGGSPCVWLCVQASVDR